MHDDSATYAADVAIARAIDTGIAWRRYWTLAKWIAWWWIAVPLAVAGWLFFAWIGYLIVRFDAYSGMP